MRHPTPQLICLLALISLSFVVNAQKSVFDSVYVLLENHPQKDTSRVTLLNELSYQSQGTNYYQALEFAEEAFALGKKLNFEKGMAVSYNRLANCYWVLGDSELAIEKALLATQLGERKGFFSILSESYRLLGVTYLDINELDKAMIFFKKSEEKCLHIQDSKMLMRVYNGIGVLLTRKKKLDSAQLMLDIALRIEQQHGYTFYKSILFNNLASVKSQLPVPPLIEVEQTFQAALSVAIQEENRFAEAGINYHVGEFYRTQKRYQESEKYLHQSLALARQMGLRNFAKQTYESLIKLESDRGDYKASNYYLQVYYNLKDSLLNEKKTRQIIELETQYEIDKKEQKIVLLEQEKKLQTLWTQMLVIGSILLLTLLVIIFYLQQQRNTKARLLISAQKELNTRLRETDQLKSRFFAHISHEFRTPLTLILAPLEVKLQSGSYSQEDLREFSLIKRNANRLLTLVNQLLDLSKLESGKLELHPHSGNLKDLLIVISASFESIAESKRIHFSKSIEFTQHWALFDHEKLETILVNILANAFKFTPMGGSVILSIRNSSEPDEIHIKISDSGKGIPEKDLPHIFSEFFQSREISDDEAMGTGLGLTLVYELVKLHHGKIEVYSRENEGTTLSIKLPITWETQEHLVQAMEVHKLTPLQTNISLPVATSEEELYSEKLLIVEDNRDLQQFISTQFQNQFTILTAATGTSGLSLATEHLPDIIIADVMMSGIDGIQLVEQLKADERTSHIPVILLTAKADIPSKLEGLRAGADDYMVKPFSTEELKVRVKGLLDARKKLANHYKQHQPDVVKEMPRVHELSMDDKFIAKLQTYIHQNISDTTLSVERLAEEMCMSRTQLFRKLKAILDTSPSELINEIRLTRAAHLIKAKTDNFTQIGYAVGFNEQSYFAKRFRKKFGMSPSEYAEANT